MKRFSVVPGSALTDRGITDSEYRTLAAIALHADREGWCYPSQGALATLRKVSRKTINQHIKKLQERGHLIVEERKRPDGGRAANSYQIVIEDSTPLLQTEVTYPVTGNGYTPSNSQGLQPMSQTEVTTPVTTDSNNNNTTYNTTEEQGAILPPPPPAGRAIVAELIKHFQSASGIRLKSDKWQEWEESLAIILEGAGGDVPLAKGRITRAVRLARGGIEQNGKIKPYTISGPKSILTIIANMPPEDDRPGVLVLGSR